MKFARYLQDTQTPEWKRAYIDYRGLKKIVSDIKKSRESAVISDSPVTSEPHRRLSDDSGPRQDEVRSEPVRSGTSGTSFPLDAGSAENVATRSRSSVQRDSEDVNSPPASASASSSMAQQGVAVSLPQGSDTPDRAHHVTAITDPGHDHQPTHRKSFFTPSTAGSQDGKGENVRKRSTSLTRFSNPLSSPPRRFAFASAPPLHELLPLLTPIERSFFTAIDAELNKVEKFYLDREQEMHGRSRLLEEQLEELVEHRRLFYATHPGTSYTHPWTTLVSSARAKIPLPKFERRISRSSAVRVTADVVQRQSYTDGDEETRTVIADAGIDLKQARDNSSSPVGGRSGSVRGLHHRVGVSTPTAAHPEHPRALDPEDYWHAKKKLKKAVLEHYRGLQVLNNYRILNLTGFRKALKKFEKVTKIPALQAYMQEKVEPAAFASGENVSTMTTKMEDLFTTRFEHGNKKKAMARLRATTTSKSHHFSTFRSGLALGLALPALVSGLYQSFQEDTRASIPGWDTLLFVYGVLLVPVLFSLLVGLNVLVWSESRINYVFIFELDVSTRLSSREYFEIPSFLLATLLYAFWLSFSRAGSPVSPTTWPLVWLGLAAFVIFDPLPIFFRPARWWLLKSLGKLLISGTRRVEFADFWMGDQLCSLIFPLSNLYLVACAYSVGFEGALQKCGASAHSWAIPFSLAALPLLARLAQSIKRYADSKLITHLINGGKYASGIVAYLFYFIWRHNGHNASLVLWCFFSTVYALYAASWDNLMDWSMLRPHAKYTFLRSELIYTEFIPMYYFAIVSNVLLRFAWVFYIPTRGPSTALRTFIGAILEMLRRWQWNFYRLENEHLGNMDQYRVTREVPLPYALDDLGDKEEHSDEEHRSRRMWLRRPLGTSSLQAQTATNEINLG